MQAAAIVLCVIAASAMGLAVRDMVLGTASELRGWTLRLVALSTFALAVVLNASR